ncbi:hypothetical protein ACCH91_000866 [Serratia marcescens]
MTLTIEELKYGAEVGDLGIDAVRAVCAEALANREAQPFGYVYTSKDGVAVNFGYELPFMPEKWNVTPVYTAPPAPALPVQHWEELCRQNPNMSIGDAIIRAAWWNHCRAELLKSATPPAPAVPDKPRLPPHIYRDLLDMLQEAAIAYGGTQQLRAQLSSALSIHVQPDHPHTRAAMLAQPVSSGYKLVPVDCLTTASRLIDLCRTYIILHGTSDYRVRTINECENTIEVIDGLLAAAPESGNDHDTRR